MTTTANERRICTNKLLMEIIEFDKALFDNSTLSPQEVKYFNSITEGFNNQTQFFIDWLDSDEARRIFYENEECNERAFGKIDEKIKEIVQDTSLTADEIISRIYDSGLQAGADEIRRTKYYNDATKFGLHFLQLYNFDLITNVNEDLKQHIKAEIFAGIAAGEGMPEVAKRILDATNHSLTGKTLTARQRAMMIARTETARAMTQGRLQSYANYGVREVKILTASDENVCAICREAETKIYLIENAGDLVPFHPLCRCSVMAYIRHGILQGHPDSDADPILCAPEVNSNVEDSFKKSAKREFEDLSEMSKVKITDYFGNTRNFKIRCSEKGHVRFYKKQLQDSDDFFRYEFINEKGKVEFTIFKSHYLQGKSVFEMLELYYSFPEILRQKCDELILSDQYYITENNKQASGFVHFEMPWMVYLMKTDNPQDLKGVLAHELAHTIDGGGFKYSNNKEKDGFQDAHNEDGNVFITGYSRDFALEALVGGKHKNRPYSEDFAECIRLFFTDREFLRIKCPAKERYLSELFNK